MNFFETKIKEDCTGCEACFNICPTTALSMKSDDEGFRYPIIDEEKCIHCALCSKVCGTKTLHLQSGLNLAFGGYSFDDEDLLYSTSGAAFFAILKSWWKPGSLIFGTCSTNVFEASHECATTPNDAKAFRGSKYTQSTIGHTYRKVKCALSQGKPVLFSGTPCAVAGLQSFLGEIDTSNLLTVEVICEGVPTPLFIEKMISNLSRTKFGKEQITSMSYRDKKRDRWDFEVMSFSSTSKSYSIDRWFNPFWSIWLNHLMSRPSCYVCPFATAERGADITLGDLWGVHLYCPNLYNDNKGTSLLICNTSKGLETLGKASSYMYLKELPYQEAIKYQAPLRRPVSNNPRREEFFEDLRTMPFDPLCKKWAKRPSFKLLISKYIYGTNRQICKKKLRKHHRPW